MPEDLPDRTNRAKLSRIHGRLGLLLCTAAPAELAEKEATELEAEPVRRAGMVELAVMLG